MIINAKRIHFKTTIYVVRAKLITRNYFITIERKIKGGYQMRLSTGSRVNILKNGRIILTGEHDIDLQEMFGLLRS